MSERDRFIVHPTPLSGLVVLERWALGDARGSFERLFSAEAFTGWGIDRPLSQVNLSWTEGKGIVRGMHYQSPPHAEDKIVSCLEGSVFDVAIDLRRGSPTFRRWHGEVLSAENRRTMLVPRGFAHGFQTLADGCRMLYLHTAPYVPAADTGVNAEDPALAITWPLPVASRSARDAAWPMLAPAFEGIAP